MNMAALMLTVLLAPAFAQSSSRFQDLALELAARIAGALTASEEVTLTVAGSDNDPAGRGQLKEALFQALKARGLRLVEQGNATSVAVACDENLRERACLAEIRRGTAREVVAVSRAHGVRAAVDRPAPLSLEVRPLFSQRAPILDVAPVGDRLFVLDPASVTLYRRSDAGWQRMQSRPIASSRPWPRDVRGRLRVDGAALEALLPGVACHAGVDLANMACVDERQPWPLGIDNSGVDASRNHFTTPEGFAFFGAATLGDDAGARWLVADQFGALSLLDAARRNAAPAGAGDDVVAVSAPCAPATHVLVSSPSATGRPDTLRLFRVVQRRLIPAALPLELSGAVTALWAAPGATVATVVTRDMSAERYEAFQIAIACDR
jgi:hypothetical protein